jgi:hypothetical protein
LLIITAAIFTTLTANYKTLLTMPRAKKTLQEQAAARQPTGGRQYQIRTLLRLFDLEGLGEWGCFGRFLISLFDHGGRLELRSMPHCRHFPGTAARNYQDAGSSGRALAGVVPGYECFSAGTPDGAKGEGKAMQFSSYSCFEQAHRWIREEQARRQMAEGPVGIPAEILSDLAEGPSDEDPEDSDPIIGLKSPIRNPTEPRSGMSDSGSSDDDQMILSSQTEAIPETATLAGDPKKKLYIHVLAVMVHAFEAGGWWGLEECVWQICHQEVSVLHLCGCGTSIPSATGSRRDCCVRPSHLRLGDAAVNRLQAHWHECIETTLASGEIEAFKGLQRAIVARYGLTYGDNTKVF